MLLRVELGINPYKDNLASEDSAAKRSFPSAGLFLIKLIFEFLIADCFLSSNGSDISPYHPYDWPLIDDPLRCAIPSQIHFHPCCNLLKNDSFSKL